MKSVTSLISGQISTEEEALIAVEEHPETLAYIPEHLLTENVLFAALIRKTELFSQVEEEKFTESLIKRLLTHKPPTREFIPQELITHEIYLSQVKEDGMWLQYVPHELRDLELCKVAIIQNVEAHQFVPNEIQNKEYLDTLILIDPDKLVDVAVENRSPRVVYKLIDNDYSVIRYIPLEYRTKKMCAKALGKSIFAIEWFPDEVYQHEEIFSVIANHDYWDNPADYDPSFKMRNEYRVNLLRPVLIDALVERDAEKYLPLIPASMVTVEHCKIAVAKNPKLTRIIPTAIRTKYNLWEVALTSDKSLLRNVRSYEKTGAIEVLAKNVKALNKEESLFDILMESP